MRSTPASCRISVCDFYECMDPAAASGGFVFIKELRHICHWPTSFIPLVQIKAGITSKVTPCILVTLTRARCHAWPVRQASRSSHGKGKFSSVPTWSTSSSSPSILSSQLSWLVACCFCVPCFDERFLFLELWCSCLSMYVLANPEVPAHLVGLVQPCGLADEVKAH